MRKCGTAVESMPPNKRDAVGNDNFGNGGLVCKNVGFYRYYRIAVISGGNYDFTVGTSANSRNSVAVLRGSGIG